MNRDKSVNEIPIQQWPHLKMTHRKLNIFTPTHFVPLTQYKYKNKIYNTPLCIIFTRSRLRPPKVFTMHFPPDAFPAFP